MIISSLFRENFVRISSLIYFMLAILYSRNVIITIPSLNPDTLLNKINQNLLQDEQLSLKYKLKSYDYFKNESVYEIINTDKMIDTLLINNDFKIKDKIINQIFMPVKKIGIGNGFEDFNKMIKARYYFINNEPAYKLGLIDDKLGAMINLDLDFESNASGLIGINRTKNNWNINGELALHIENYFFNAESINLYWKGVDSLSQLVKIGLDLPHPFGINTGISLDYHHEVYKGMFSSIENKLLLKTFLPIFNSIGIGYTYGKIKPTEEGIDLGYDYVSYESFSINTKKNNTNSRFLPSFGNITEINVDGGLDRNMRFIKSSIFYKKIFPFYNQAFINFIINGKFILYQKNSIPKSRYFRYGGASSLRGYDEQQFQSPQYNVSSFELCYKPRDYIQVMLFLDMGSDQLSSLSNYLYGYGLGLRQISRDSVINIEYALSDLNLENGKLHIKWMTRF